MRIIAAIGLVLTAAAGFAQVDPSRTVVVVNGEAITGGEYYHHMEYLPNMGRILESGQVLPVSPGLLAIVELVNRHLLLQLTKQKNLYPTNDEVDALIKQSMVDDPNLLTNWIAQGRTEDELKDVYRTTIARFKLQTEGITVSDQEVADFFHKEAIPGLTVSPRTVTLRIISVSDTDTEKAVDADLSGGQPFADVAKVRSTDVTKERGGLLGPLPTDALPKDVVQVLDQTKVGNSTAWLDQQIGDANTPETIHTKYLIVAKEAQKPLEFDKMKDQIRRKMMLDRGNVRNNVEKEISDLRQTSKIDIKNKVFAEAYIQFMRANYHEKVQLAG